MADKRISQLVERTDIANNDVVPIVASGATTTNKATISSIQEFMQENLDLGVTSVGITLGSSGTDVSVTGSPITTSGNITINLPTASATNRGALSSADWTTFNDKQNTITLTTTGTEGAATLSGSTLNIPNYSTGVANAYVPYIGAIDDVDLGFNDLDAGIIKINGASAAFGGHLGFRHSNSVASGGDGYTSISTLGSTSLRVRSVSGSFTRAFNFNMAILNPSGTERTYTLPDVSGTLALTSDLTGYVTLDTAQTITAQKTFSTSGGSDTAIINHGSGSGIALNITKAGNGEGLRVTKTSGSGNAMSIIGGNFGAEDATFSEDILVNGVNLGRGAGSISTNTRVGTNALTNNTTGSSNTGVGLLALGNNSTGARNTSIGEGALMNNTTGNDNVAVGVGAGVFLTDGSSQNSISNNSVFIGASTKSSVNNQTNQIVIGHNATGNGSNTVTLGNDSITNTYLKGAVTLTGALNGTSASFTGAVNLATSSGNVGIGTASPTQLLELNGTSNLRFAMGSSHPYIQTNNQDLNFGTRTADLMVIKSNGNVGIGTASPATNLHIAGTTEMRFGTTSSGSLIQFWKDSSASFASSIGNAIPGGSVQNDLLFATYDGSAWSEQMRITSEGYVLVGSDTIPGAGTTTIGSSLGTAGFITAQRNAATVGFFGRNSSDGELFAFYRDSTQVGNISVTSVLTTYNTTSDYRLKEDLQEFNGLEKVQAIKVYDYKWKAQESRMNGVLAHELAEVLPYAVSGEKDEVDEKGNDKMQGVDYSKIVPILIKAIQEQQVQIDSLKNQIK